MTDHYAVFGNPIAHSKSPRIHAEFARQTGQDLTYEAIEAPLNDFAGSVRRFQTEGGAGANVTVPFKLEAFMLSQEYSDRARIARAVNTLSFKDGRIVGDNTDGIGLVRDIRDNLAISMAGRQVLMVGAGGAAFGVLLPLLMELPGRLLISNRTMAKAEEAVRILSGILGRADWPAGHPVEVIAKPFAELAGESFDLVINATSASLTGELPPLPDDLFAKGALAYDMMYGRDTPFLAFARRQGVRTADGLGMLVEQAAESFRLWRGMRPDTRPVIDLLRRG